MLNPGMYSPIIGVHDGRQLLGCTFLGCALFGCALVAPTMDYVVGNVAALIAGNVTPNRPKLSKRALTPIKHMPSPNVTPKSELVDDRSIFLSPSVQKKKAIVKKSPKRIFQNPDLDATNENEGNTSTSSPKADKVKKHLKGELEATVSPKNNSKVAKTSESKQQESPSPKKKAVNGDVNNLVGDYISPNQSTLKKNKKKRNSIAENSQSVTESIESNPSEGTPKKNKKKRNSISEVSENVIELPKKSKNQNKENVNNTEATNEDKDSVKTPKKKKKNKNKPQSTEPEESDIAVNVVNSEHNETEAASPKKKNKKRKQQHTHENSKENKDSKPTKNKKVKVNPNAITDKDSDSEHESDNEIESETEENNKEALEKSAEPEEPSSDEEDTHSPKKKEKVESQETEKVRETNTEEEIKRTLFVGNVPFSKKCKKEIKSIFKKYGQIESVRIRTIPVKDPSVTPKLAVIKQELHPERSTVNVYVKFSDPQCVEQALAENNTVLNNNHLRVTRSSSTGAEHDPRHSVFVGNIPFALEDEGLREKFDKCGEIQSVRIVRDRKTNAGKGFGYVNFTSRDGVELALALTDEDLTIKNRIMRVKRCTQVTQRQAQKGNNRPGFQGKKISQGDRQRNQAAGKFNQGRNPGKFQGNRAGNFQGNGGNFQGNRGNFQGNRGNFQGNRGNFQGNRGNFQNRGGNFQNKGGNFQGRSGNSFGRQNDEKEDGAQRRLLNKRKSQEGTDDQPREKKPRKEFVGMTAEKKKKRKFDKGQKKKKALSEILTK